MKITKLLHDEKNRMGGFRFGLHDGKWFIRLDLWWCGFRLKRRED